MIEGVTDFRFCHGLEHPELNVNGRRNRMIGRGTFARVYESRHAKRVLKVTTDEYAYMAHTDAVAKLGGKYFPRVYRDFGVIGHMYDGRALYMVEIERLKAARLPRYWYAPPCIVPDWVVKKVREFVDQYDGRCIEDIHSKNIMRRVGTGDYVVCDPVCDYDQMREYEHRYLYGGGYSEIF